MMRNEFAYVDAAQPTPEEKTATGGLVAGAAIGALAGRKPSVRIRRGAKLGALGALLGLAGGIGYDIGQKEKETSV